MLDYSKLRPCQVVVCAGRNWFVKLWMWVLSGFQKWPDRDDPTYVGLVYDIRGEFLVAHMPTKKGVRLSSFAEFMTKKRWIVDILDTSKLNYADRESIQQAIAKEFRYILSKTGEHKQKGVTAKVNEYCGKSKRDETFVAFMLKFYCKSDVPSYTQWPPVDCWKVEA
jgi:hypothetical protein